MNWPALKELREIFLGESVSANEDYWTSPELLEAYDATFAQRIGWKWDAVLAELRLCGWQPASETLVDWGCGTGIAARKFLAMFGADTVRQIQLFDRSKPAADFAVKKLSETFSGTLSNSAEIPTGAVVLLSHVLNELSTRNLNSLLDSLAGASAVIWVEPGTPAHSQRLIAIREKLRAIFSFVAPCPHQNRCGLLAKERAEDWCHHFAKPPGGIFQQSEWSRFSKELKIDLRSLPVSYLVFAKAAIPKPEPAQRFLGRARMYKGHAKVLVCRDSEVVEEQILQRKNKVRFRKLKEGAFVER